MTNGGRPVTGHTECLAFGFLHGDLVNDQIFAKELNGGFLCLFEILNKIN